MVIVRCTQKLLKRLSVTPEPDPPPSTTAMGDWTCNLLRVGRVQVILCVNHTTLLPILLPAREARTFPTRLAPALEHMLAMLEVPAPPVMAEVAAMAPYHIAKTNDRRVLSTLKEFAYMAEFRIESAEPGPLLKISRWLADRPCGAIKYHSPRHAVQALFAAT